MYKKLVQAIKYSDRTGDLIICKNIDAVKAIKEITKELSNVKKPISIKDPITYANFKANGFKTNHLVKGLVTVDLYDTEYGDYPVNLKIYTYE